MKWLVSVFAFLYMGALYANSVDFSQGNTNPHRQYLHHLAAQPSNVKERQATKQATISQESFVLTGNTAAPLPNNELSCWERAAHAYGLDPWLLVAVAKVESSFNPNAINRSNRNGSVDVGLMQINSFWFPRLERMGIKKQHLFNPCVSIFVGAWIMSYNIRRHGMTKRGIGAYNSMNRETQIRYANRVIRAHAELTQRFR